MQRRLVVDFFARNIFRAKQTEQQWAFHARILQSKRSTFNCEGVLFTYLPHSEVFDLFVCIYSVVYDAGATGYSTISVALQQANAVYATKNTMQSAESDPREW